MLSVRQPEIYQVREMPRDNSARAGAVCRSAVQASGPSCPAAPPIFHLPPMSQQRLTLQPRALPDGEVSVLDGSFGNSGRRPAAKAS